MLRVNLSSHQIVFLNQEILPGFCNRQNIAYLYITLEESKELLSQISILGIIQIDVSRLRADDAWRSIALVVE